MTGSHVERLFISAVLREADHVTPMAAGVNEDWFGVHGPEWGFIAQYVRQHGRCPTVTLFEGKWGDFGVLKKAENVKYLVEELRSAYVYRSLVSLATSTGESLKAGNAPTAVLAQYQAALRQLAVAAFTHIEGFSSGAWNTHLRTSSSPWASCTSIPRKSVIEQGKRAYCSIICLIKERRGHENRDTHTGDIRRFPAQGPRNGGSTT